MRAETDTLRTAVVGIAVVILLLLLAFVSTQLVQQIRPEPTTGSDTVQIDSCTRITDPGQYVLTADLENRPADRCIRISADDVVFDGDGHTVDGVGAFGSGGVLVGGGSNVTVRNVVVTDWDDGIRYIDAVRGTVERTTTANNRVGLTLLGSNGTLVSNNTATSNAVYGISLQEASSGNTVRNSTATANSLFGIHLVGAETTNNTLTLNTAANNEYGIVLVGARENAIVGNDATGNRIAGIWLSEADGNYLANNSVSNQFYGIYLGDQSSRNSVVSNVAADNAVGIRLAHSDRNRVSTNAVTGSSAEGILLLASDHNVLAGNVLSENARPVRVVRSENVTRSNGSGSSSRKLVPVDHDGKIPVSSVG